MIGDPLSASGLFYLTLEINLLSETGKVAIILLTLFRFYGLSSSQNLFLMNAALLMRVATLLRLIKLLNIINYRTAVNWMWVNISKNK